MAREDESFNMIGSLQVSDVALLSSSAGCSSGADIGQGATDIGGIAADEIVVGAFGRAAERVGNAGAVPRGGRMGKPEDPSEAYGKAYYRVVGGRAIDGHDGRAK